jgi:cysteine desulfurase / selenocysteine lyase
MIHTEHIRTLFPYLDESLAIKVAHPSDKTRVFLDNTASTQIPKAVLEHIAKTSFNYANIHRGEYDASQITTEEFEKSYNTIANLVNAASWREIILGRNTTEMINLVMNLLGSEIQSGDNIVTTRLEHNSNYVPWHGLQQLLKQQGKSIDIRLVDFDKLTGQLRMDQLAKYVDAKTKLVTVTGASNFLGTKPDLKKIGAIAHGSKYVQPTGNRGSYFLVDGAQLVPHALVDVQDINCDFLAWSFHKMSLPFGVGGLYARKDVIETMRPFLYGGDMIEDVKEGEVKFKDLPWKYTAGTPNILGTIATGFGVSYLLNMALGNTIPGNGHIEINDQMCRSIEMDILMNTPRGDFAIPYEVPSDLEDSWNMYLNARPGKFESLKDPQQRLIMTRNLVAKAMKSIHEHEQELTAYALDRIVDLHNVTVYGSLDATERAGLIAMNVKGMDPQVVAFELNKRGIEVRNGTHCASLAHQYLGIDGSIRMSFYVYNDHDDVDKGVQALKEIAAGEIA